MNWTLLKNSLLVSAPTTLMAVASGFFVALFLAGLEWRWRRWWIGGAVMGLALPPFLITGCWLHLLGLTGVWRIWLRRREISWPRLEGAVSAGVFRRQLGAGWFRVGGFFAVGATFLSVGLPLTDLCASGRTWLELFPAFKAGQGAAINSAIFSMVSAALVVGVALATWRWPLGVIVWLPFLVPGVLVGFVLIFVFNSRVLSLFYQSVGIVFLAWTLRYLAVGWNTTAHALGSVDRDLSDSARLEGASRWQLLRHIHWPQIAPQIAAAWYLTYLFCLWDAEAP